MADQSANQRSLVPASGQYRAGPAAASAPPVAESGANPRYADAPSDDSDNDTVDSVDMGGNESANNCQPGDTGGWSMSSYGRG